MNKNSRLLVYLTGHGGNGYIKIQDTDVMLAEDLQRIMLEASKK